MEVYRRKGSPNWYVDLVDPRTKQRKRTSLKFKGSKVEAQKRARELEGELEGEAKETKEGRRPITVREALDRYVASLQAKGQAAAKDHAYRRDRLLGLSDTAAGLWTLDGERKLHDLTPADMEALVLARTKEGKKPQTIKHELGLLRAATRYVAGLGFRTPTVMIKGEIVNPWRTPKVVEKTRYLSPEEYQRVYAYLDPDRPIDMEIAGKVVSYTLPEHIRAARAEARDLLVALTFTGGRWSEVAHLTWDRVDLKAGLITLWAGKVEKERMVAIPEPLADVLRRRLAGRRVGQSLVFPGPGGRPRSQPTAAIGDAMTAVGLNEKETVEKFGRATVHSLRHTYASWLVQNGADLGEVRDALGHASITMTGRYSHLSKKATAAKLGGILSKLGASNERSDVAEPAEQSDP